MPPHDYEGRFYSGSGQELSRITIEKSYSDWVIQFGLDGPNVGLQTVRVTDDPNLNILGVLELALAELRPSFKQANSVGVALRPIFEGFERD